MTTPSSSIPPTSQAPVSVEVSGGVCRITLRRPQAFNAFNDELKTELLAAVKLAGTDDDIRVVVLAGEGRAFCAGQDLKEHLAKVTNDDPSIRQTVSEFYTPLIMTITQMDKPVLAAISGVAAGAGAALAFACDLRVASESARFALAFADAGLAADSGASFTLPRLVGTGAAMRMMLLGEKVDAREAYRLGMVDFLCSDADFSATVDGIAGRLAAGPRLALGWIKASVRHAATHDLASSLLFEDEAQRACFASDDHREALDAFVAKRPPRFH